MKTEITVLELFYKDMENHSIKFAKWMSKKGYENIFKDTDKDGKTWASFFNEEERFTIKELYKKFMIDYLCS
jgi:hypothetical protein